MLSHATMSPGGGPRTPPRCLKGLLLRIGLIFAVILVFLPLSGSYLSRRFSSLPTSQRSLGAEDDIGAAEQKLGRRQLPDGETIDPNLEPQDDPNGGGQNEPPSETTSYSTAAEITTTSSLGSSSSLPETSSTDEHSSQTPMLSSDTVGMTSTATMSSSVAMSNTEYLGQLTIDFEDAQTSAEKSAGLESEYLTLPVQETRTYFGTTMHAVTESHTSTSNAATAPSPDSSILFTTGESSTSSSDLLKSLENQPHTYTESGTTSDYPRSTEPPSESHLQPVAILRAPEKFGGCDESQVYLDASSSRGDPPLRYSWTLINSDQSSSPLQQALKNATMSNAVVVTSAQGAFQVGSTYVIQLEVRDSRGNVASTSAAMTRVPSILPTVTFRGGPGVQFPRGQAVTLGARASLPSCVATDVDNTLIFAWEITSQSGSRVDLQSSSAILNAPELYVPPRSLDVGRYHVVLTVYRKADEDSPDLRVLAETELEIVRGRLVAGIVGGNRSEGLGRDVSLSAAHPSSFDEDDPSNQDLGLEFFWKCISVRSNLSENPEITGRGCFANEIQTPDIVIHSLAEAGPKLDPFFAYSFQVRVVDKYGRESISLAEISTEPGLPPRIKVFKTFPLSDFAEFSKTLVLETVVSELEDPREVLSYLWTVTSDDSLDLDLSNQTVASATVPGRLVIYPNQLLANVTHREYTFSVRVTANQGNATASIVVPVNLAPIEGSLTAVTDLGATTGSAYEDTWTIAASGWLDEQGDSLLRYQFSAVDSGSKEIYLGVASASQTKSTILAAGITKICVTVEDVLLARSRKCVAVTVTSTDRSVSQRYALAENYLERDLARLAQDGDVDSALAMASVVMDLVANDGADAEDASQLVVQQVRIVNTVGDLVNSLHRLDSSIANAAIATVGRVEASNLSSNDLLVSLDLLGTLVSAATIPPPHSQAQALSIDSEASQRVGRFLSGALNLQAEVSSQSMHQATGPLAKRQELSAEDSIFSLLDSLTFSLVNGRPCDANPSPEQLDTPAFQARVNKVSRENSNIPTESTPVVLGSYKVALPTSDLGMECFTYQVIEFGTGVKGSASPSLNITTPVMRTKLFDTSGGAHVSSNAKLDFKINGDFGDSQNMQNRCTTLDGDVWRSNACITEKLSDAELHCLCPYENSFHSAQLLSSDKTVPAAGANVAVIAGGTAGGLLAVVALVAVGVVMKRKR